MSKIFKNPIYVTSPLLPDSKEVQKEIEQILESKWLTNHGKKHNEFEKRLTEVLKVPNASVFNNGTIALLTALKALDIPMGSEVITTPFTFAATPHCISWNGLTPVFCDIEPDIMTIDANKIEEVITPKTKAILPVHVYGFPCDVNKIDEIAKKHNLKVIYDGAHTFSTELDGKSIGTYGDITMYSFHATKLFNSIEGGCLTYNDPVLKEKVYNLRNFGIKNENEVVDIGINGKLNEIQSAIGLLNLTLFENEKQKRIPIKKVYDEMLGSVEGITIPKMPPNATNSMQYYVIKIDNRFKESRDSLYDRLKEHNIYTRKYFSPLCSEYEPYKTLPSSKPNCLPVANEIKEQVLCLPYYGELSTQDATSICELILKQR